MSKWNVGDKVQHKDSKQHATVDDVYHSGGWCRIKTDSGAYFTVKDKEIEVQVVHDDYCGE